MYAEFFSIEEEAFSIAPNPRYLYLSAKHREAYAHLIYGVTRPGGFVLLTGDIGTGKTTLCRSLFADLPQNTNLAVIINPALSQNDLLSAICDEFGISYPVYQNSTKVYIDGISQYLLDTHAQGRNAVLLIDEAQNLSIEALECIRALTNLETDEKKLLQIVLVGQPELRNLLAKPALIQLNQRITARYHLLSLSRDETSTYIRHRLKTAGADEHLFSASNIRYIQKITSGIPRLINVLCDRSLLGAYTQREHKISNLIIRKSAQEVFDVVYPKENTFYIKPLGIAASVLLTFLVAGMLLSNIFKSDEFNVEAVSSAHAVVVPQVQRKESSAGESIIPLEEPTSTSETAHIQPANATSAPQHEDNRRLLSLAEKDRRIAFYHLLALWNIEYSDLSIDPCEYAVLQQLRCWHTQGVVQTILNLNRPVIVHIRNDENQLKYAVIESADEGELWVTMQDQATNYSIDSLSKRWDGSIQLIWKPLSSYQLIKPGVRGEVVTKLEVQLAKIASRPQRDLPNLIYDTSLINDIKAFQHDKRLHIDGVIGPVTQIHLNTAAHAGMPRLY